MIKHIVELAFCWFEGDMAQCPLLNPPLARWASRASCIVYVWLMYIALSLASVTINHDAAVLSRDSCGTARSMHTQLINLRHYAHRWLLLMWHCLLFYYA